MDGKAPDGVANPNAQKITLYRNVTPGAVYYYPMQKKYDYTFYGYAPYQTDQTVSAANPTVEFTAFNGSQDIIWQKAGASTIDANSIYVAADKTNDVRLTGYKAQYIRQLKYHHELNETAANKLTDYPWIPNLQFEHKLAQLRFSVIAANDQSAEDKAASQKLTVKGVTIKKHGTTAQLDIPTGKLTFTNPDETGNLTMRKATDDGAGKITFSDEEETGNLTVNYKDTYYATDNTRTNPPVQGYLMVKPDEATYYLDITITSNDVNGIPNELIVRDIPINAPEPPADSGNIDKKFYAGKYYNVRIGIYATQDINITATLDTWQSGGSDIDIPVE